MTTPKHTTRKTRAKQDYAPHIDEDKAPPCAIEGCNESGLYKAPKGKEKLGEYQFLCLDHIREYNANWDYLKDLDRDEIESFMKDAIIGHRPTWKREENLSHREAKLHEALEGFLGITRSKSKPQPPSLPAKVRKALATMDMEYPYTLQSLKTQYRTLVKKLHPDKNKGDKQAEESFKSMIVAYKELQIYLEKNL